MKYFILSCVLLASLSLQAQTTAQDWTKNDCDGNPHHLFAELNAGQVIIVEYVMLDCAPCVTAANGLKAVYNNFNTSHPGKVKSYSIGFIDSYTCADLQSWKTTNNLSHTTMFPNGASDVAYYGGMGMPTIVVLGGPYHKVFYKKLGYAPSDNNTITAAINSALVATGIDQTLKQVITSVYPNPGNGKITFELKENAEVTIVDLSGKTIAEFGTLTAGIQHIDLKLTAGLYLLQVNAHNGFIQREKILVN
jgi:hypothetical protein